MLKLNLEVTSCNRGAPPSKIFSWLLLWTCLVTDWVGHPQSLAMQPVGEWVAIRIAEVQVRVMAVIDVTVTAGEQETRWVAVAVRFRGESAAGQRRPLGQSTATPLTTYLQSTMQPTKKHIFIAKQLQSYALKFNSQKPTNFVLIFGFC